MQILQLNEDILYELLGHLDILESANLLTTSRTFYFSPALWVWALQSRKNIGPLSCAQGLDLSTADLEQLRRIAFKTASLWSNWYLPDPRSKSLQSYQVNPRDELLSCIPGTDVALTVSFLSGYESEPCFRLKCYDLRTGKEMCRYPVWSHWLTQYAGHQIYDGIRGIFRMAIVTTTYHERAAETLIHVIDVDYSNRNCVVMDNTHRIVLEGYAASSDFRIHITDETLLIVAASPTAFQISYALVDLAECEVLDTVRLIAVKVDFSCIVNPTMLEFFRESDRIHAVIRSGPGEPAPTLYTCSINTSLPPSSKPLQPEVFHFENWLAGRMAKISNIFDVYDVSLSHPDVAPVLLLVKESETTFCPVKVMQDGKVMPDVLREHHITLPSADEDEDNESEEPGMVANTVAFTTHAGLATLGEMGTNALTALQLLVYDPRGPSWSVRRLGMPPQIDLTEFTLDGTYDLDQHTGTVVLWTKKGMMHVVRYV